MNCNLNRSARIGGLFLTLLLFSSCASPSPRPETSKSPSEKTEDVLTLEAEISRKDGKIVARLIRGTGDKAIDDSILAILEAMKDSYSDLKEGESMSVQLDNPRKE